MSLSDRGYWSEKINPDYECGNCGGCVRIDGSAPIAKGSITAYKCIRCSSTGTVKWRIAWSSSKLRGLVKR